MEDAQILLEDNMGAFRDGESILVTGGSGLIGINLLAFLLVYHKCLSKLNVYVNVIESSSKNFIQELFADCPFHFLSINLTSTSEGDQKIHFDTIFHLATYGQPHKFGQEPLTTLELNSVGLVAISRLLKPGGRIFFASTSEIYSGNKNLPHVEGAVGTTTTTHPRACYIEAKRFGEAYCYCLGGMGFRTYSGRLSLAYGPGFRAGDRRVLNEFLLCGAAGQPIRMLDSGTAVRVYCYIRDTIDMVISLIQTDYHEPINVAGISRTSVLDLANLIASRSGVEVIIGDEDVGLRGAPSVVSSSTDAAIRVLGKDSFVSIEEGVERSLIWAKALTRLH